MILLANKYDLIESIEKEGQKLEDYMTQQFLDEYAAEHSFVGAVRGSAKTGANISSAFSTLVREIFKREISVSVENAPT